MALEWLKSPKFAVERINTEKLTLSVWERRGGAAEMVPSVGVSAHHLQDKAP